MKGPGRFDRYVRSLKRARFNSIDPPGEPEEMPVGKYSPLAGPQKGLQRSPTAHRRPTPRDAPQHRTRTSESFAAHPSRRRFRSPRRTVPVRPLAAPRLLELSASPDAMTTEAEVAPATVEAVMPNADAPVDAKVDKAETEVKSESKDAPKEVPKPDQPRLPKPDRAALEASIAELQEAADVQQARIETLKRAIESRREKRKNITSGSQETRARIGELNAAFSTHMVRPVPPRDATVVPRLSRAPDPPISATPAALQAFALRNRRPEPIARASPAPPSAATMRSTSPRSPASLEIAASALSASRPATPPRSPHDASAAFGRGKSDTSRRHAPRARGIDRARQVGEIFP